MPTDASATFMVRLSPADYNRVIDGLHARVAVLQERRDTATLTAKDRQGLHAEMDATDALVKRLT